MAGGDDDRGAGCDPADDRQAVGGCWAQPAPGLGGLGVVGQVQCRTCTGEQGVGALGRHCPVGRVGQLEAAGDPQAAAHGGHGQALVHQQEWPTRDVRYVGDGDAVALGRHDRQARGPAVRRRDGRRQLRRPDPGGEDDLVGRDGAVRGEHLGRSGGDPGDGGGAELGPVGDRLGAQGPEQQGRVEPAVTGEQDRADGVVHEGLGVVQGVQWHLLGGVPELAHVRRLTPGGLQALRPGEHLDQAVTRVVELDPLGEQPVDLGHRGFQQPLQGRRPAAHIRLGARGSELRQPRGQLASQPRVDGERPVAAGQRPESCADHARRRERDDVAGHEMPGVRRRRPLAGRADVQDDRPRHPGWPATMRPRPR